VAIELTLFHAPTDPQSIAGARADQLHGLSVQLSNECQCGSRIAAIGEGKGPHRVTLFCNRCEEHRGWLPNEAHVFLTEVVRIFGTPKTPIKIQRKQSKGE
jgi:hypothetical protein